MVLKKKPCASQKVQTAGGVDLYLGMVADGVGGRRVGERAITLAVEIALAYISDYISQAGRITFLVGITA